MTTSGVTAPINTWNATLPTAWCWRNSNP